MPDGTRLRWELADGPRDQGALFEQPVFEREPGRGEFRGLEFLHVRARTIINEVKGAPLPPLPLHDQRVQGLQPCLHLLFRAADARVPGARQRAGLRAADRGEGQRGGAAAGRARPAAVARATTSPWARTPTRTSGPRASTGSPARSSRCSARRPTRSRSSRSRTLVLRDLDVLVAAAERTDVRVNLSIGTLDTDVWRPTEPGTPHPRRGSRRSPRSTRPASRAACWSRRSCPGLSDGREQLEAVVDALRRGRRRLGRGDPAAPPARREGALPRLAARHAAAAPRPVRAALRDRANAPKDERRRVAALVGAAVRRHGRRAGDRLRRTGARRSWRRGATVVAAARATGQLSML